MILSCLCEEIGAMHYSLTTLTAFVTPSHNFPMALSFDFLIHKTPPLLLMRKKMAGSGFLFIYPLIQEGKEVKVREFRGY